jgi:drug/metabolite transporter (DMT)-like permease
MLQQRNKNLERLLHVMGLVSNRIGTENFALAMMAIANLVWPLTYLFVSQHHFSPFQTNLARGTAICITHILICLYLGIDLNFKSWKDLKYLFLRNTLITIHQLFYAALHFVLSFPLLNSILITGPLFVFIIDYYLNGVTINQRQIWGIAISFVGILININGELIMKIIDPSF